MNLKWAKNFRSSEWWNYKLPPLLGLFYLQAHHLRVSWQGLFFPFLAVLLWMISAASFGYFLNDLFDMAEDRARGKHNMAAGLRPWNRFFTAATLLVGVFLPWTILGGSWWLFFLVAFQVLSFSLYSIPPVRLKERMFWGVLTDALYAHLIPALIVVLVLVEPKHHSIDPLFVGMVVSWQLLVGVRNIFLHQIRDSLEDYRAGLKTLANQEQSGKWIFRFLSLVFPLELISFLGLFLLHPLTTIANTLLLIVLMLLAWKAGRLYSGRNGEPADFTLQVFGFANTCYEVWFPILVLLSLVESSVNFLGFLLIHLVLFPQWHRVIPDHLSILKALFRKG